MVSPRRLSVKKENWPKYKNRISFQKSKKTNSKSFTGFGSLGGKRLRREFKTNQRGVEACRDFQVGVSGGAAVTSVSPRYWGAAWEDRAHRAASRGRRPSRLRRSRCCWSPDRWESTAQRARPGPGTPVRGVRAGVILKNNYSEHQNAPSRTTKPFTWSLSRAFILKELVKRG